MTPDLNSFSPPILIATEGKPSYGQVMLAEFLATYIFVSVVLVAKRNSSTTLGINAAAWILSIGITLIVVIGFVGEISGGVVNPAVATALILWQQFTLNYNPDATISIWTYEYAIGYIIGPLFGSLIAGIMANIIEVTKKEMNELEVEDNQSEAITNQIEVSFADGASQHSNSF